MTTHSLTYTGASEAPARASRHANTAARIVLGLVFFVFGLNGFLNFIPPPPPETMPAGALAFGTALMNTGYMIPLIKGSEVLCGALLLSNRFVPLALVVLAPIVVNIILFHAVLAPSGVIMAVVVLLLELGLAWSYRDAYRPLLRAR